MGLFRGAMEKEDIRVNQNHAYQMLSLSATAMHGVKGWNLTTEGTPGFLFRNIWSSSLVMPVGDNGSQLFIYSNTDIAFSRAAEGEST